MHFLNSSLEILNKKFLHAFALFNLLIGLDGFTVSSGVIDDELNGDHIVARLLELDEKMRIGIITKKNVILSRYAVSYIEAVRKYI